MPSAIYIFSLCTFAFGLSEFVVAGLVSAIAADLHADIGTVGAAIAAYAFGAAIGAPVITALVSHWQDKHILVTAMIVLAIGAFLMALSPGIITLLAVRFLVGLAHGVFMAVASDAATKLVDPTRAGRALSVVWIGLTLALAFGVPIGTFLGNIWSWRLIFVSIGALSVLSIIGLVFFMPARDAKDQAKRRESVWVGIKAITHVQLLITAGIGVLVSVATFTFFTFISPYLLQVIQIDVEWLSVAMLAFGICSIIGNLVGGYVVDAIDANRGLMAALAGLAVNLMGLYLLRGSPISIVLLVGALGVLFFSIVTMLTLRLLKLAQHFIPRSTAVAAGLNIASFNLGTAVGGALGSITIAYGYLPYIPIVGSLAAALAVAALWLQLRHPKRQDAGATLP
jgi:predicted MFS family arabinose efflux permease